MDRFARYAVYYAPRPGMLATRAAAWLGWDPERGIACDHPRLDLPVGLARLTDAPRRYGFHATLRPPFRPADGCTQGDVESCIAGLAANLPRLRLPRLDLSVEGGFLSYRPSQPVAALDALATAVVDGTNHLRAPLTKAEIARRRPDGLSHRQKQLLDRYGYPYVIEEFRFHLTLTGQLTEDTVPDVAAAARSYIGAVMPVPFLVEDLCLFGEDAEGRFHLLHRYALTG